MTESSLSPADTSSALTSQHQLPHDQLLEFLNQTIEHAGNNIISVLVMELGRTNRMDTITGKISMQALMQHTSQCLDKLLRDVDRYTHFTSELICLVLPGLINENQSVLATIKILSEFQEPFMIGQHEIVLRPHIGIASFPEMGLDAAKLLMHADIASRIAATHEQGYHIFRLEDQLVTEAYSGLDIELGKALKANELRVHYQPQIDIKTGRCVSAEALIRWTTEDGRVINPAILIRIAESCGLIDPLTLWILNTALRHTAEFAAIGIDIGISVNLSPSTLEDDELPQIIQQSLDIWGVPASKLTLEITEGSMMKDFEYSLAMLNRLRELGISLAIDDFGTGYSSLAYLKRLPVQELKVDIMFVRNIHNSHGDTALVRTIIDLARNFDLKTVAEGVEDEKTFDLIKELDCDIIQGYLFSKALSDTDFIDWYQAHTARNG